MNNSIPTKCEVIIIGGGPAGSMAAAQLAQNGIDVVLIEQQQFPRDTVGENLIPHVWKYLDLMGVSEKIEAAGFVQKTGGIVQWDNTYRKMDFKDFGYTRHGMHVERDLFDHILLEHAKELGARVLMPVKVTKTELGEQESRVTYKDMQSNQTGTITCQYMVDSSGQAAIVSRQENNRIYDDGFRFNAFWGYYTGGQFLDGQMNVRPFGEQKKHIPQTVISTIGDWGWVWQIILQEKTSVGIIIPKHRIAEFKKRGTTLEERFHSLVLETPLTGTLMNDAQLIAGSVRSIKDYAYTPAQLSIKNCYLAGDAAAFVDPINSLGVIMALYAGYFSAWCIRQSLQKPQRKPFFKKLYQEQLSMRMDLFRLIAYPAHLHTPEMLAEGSKVFSQLSKDELYLALTQTNLISRGENIKEMFNLPDKELHEEWQEEELNQLLFPKAE